MSFDLWAGGLFKGSHVLPSIVAQVIGGVLAGGVIKLVASGRPGFLIEGDNALATNGFGTNSPGGYGLIIVLVVEIVMSFFFILIILGGTIG